MDPIIDAFYVLSDDAGRDKELKDWFTDVNGFVRTVGPFLSSMKPPENRHRSFSKRDTSWKTSVRKEQAS